MTFHCLFEQSGTFKNVFKEFGHKAFDYDILDDYGQTDFKIDLFKEIEREYKNLVVFPTLPSPKRYSTIFTKMKPGADFIMAFFPCTHFCDFNSLTYRRYVGGGIRVDLDERCIARLIDRNKERAKYFEIYMKFCFICTALKIPTIIENPASKPANYLELFSPIDVAWHEKDRSDFGDRYKKPTNFFAINFEMFCNKRYDLKNILKQKNENGIDRQKLRSEITSEYARNFCKRFLAATMEKQKECVL